MKIAVLEWVCGGGLTAPTSGVEADAHADLRQEGWAMLSCLVQGCGSAGHDVYTTLSDHAGPKLAELPTGTQIVHIGSAAPRAGGSGVPQAWLTLAAACEATIVVAPECDGILESSISKLQNVSPLLLNCTDPFLATAACKWKTACLLEAWEIPHPATRRLGEVDAAWLEQVKMDRHAGQHLPAQWVVKPNDGAGCEHLRILSDGQLEALLHAVGAQRERTDVAAHAAETLTASDCIVQPWLEGIALSCSAIVAANSQPNWLPLVRQKLNPRPSTEGIVMQSLAGDLLGQALPPLPPHEPLLERLIAACGAGARGWIGVDLLYCPSTRDWTIVEINPRLTTSVVPLSTAYAGNLIGDLISICSDRQIRLSPFGVSDSC